MARARVSAVLAGGLLVTAAAAAFDVHVDVPIPKGVQVTAEEVTLTPLPAGKKLAVICYVDRAASSLKRLLPEAKAISDAGWRATFFVAAPPDVAELAPQLEALGHEVATNLASGGISAYSHEMFGYSRQEILDAIGPLRSDLNAALKRPVLTQLIRGHGVPFRDRVRALGYLGATHWYRHYVFLAREGDPKKTERQLSFYRGKGVLPVVNLRGLDDAAFAKAVEGGARAVILTPRRIDEPTRAFLKSHGGKAEYWYTTFGELFSTVYVRQNAKVSSVELLGDRAHVVLSVPHTFNPLFVRAPIGIALGETTVDVPASALIEEAPNVSLKLDPPRIRLPGETRLTVKVKGLGSTSNYTMDLTTPPGFDQIEERRVSKKDTIETEYVLRSNARAGTHTFGFLPITHIRTIGKGAAARTFMTAAELEVRPAVRCDVFPHRGVPIAPGGSQTFMITIDNRRHGPGRGNWRTLRKQFEKFILPPEGELNAKVTFPASDAFTVEPADTDLTLAAEGESRTFHVTVTNTAAAKEPYRLLPQITLAGEKQPLLLPFAGTPCWYVADLAKPMLDERGLTMYASWDTLDGGNSPGVDKARGVKASYQGAMGIGRIAKGLLGNALLHNTVCLLDPWLHYTETEGTMMFWLKNDPTQEKPFTAARRERLFAVLTHHPAQNVDTGLMSLQLVGNKRLEARMMTIGPVYHRVSAPFTKSDDWRHVALSWSCREKFLRIHVDGKLAGELTDDGRTWHAYPARSWPYGRGDFMTPLSDDHGAYTSTMRDEFHLFNRPLSEKEIQQHIRTTLEKAKQP